MFRLLVPLRCGEGLALLSPLLLLRPPAALYGVCPGLRAVPALGCSTKARNKKLRLLFVPSPSGGSGSQELDGRTLPGCGTPSTLVPSSSPRPRQMGTCALCLAETLPADVDHPESQEIFD